MEIIYEKLAEGSQNVASSPNYHIADSNGSYGHDWLTKAENNLIEAEASLGEAKAVLSKARTVGVVYATVTMAQDNVRNAEAMVQAKQDVKDIAIEIRTISERQYHIEESSLLDEGAHIEVTRPFSEQQQDIIEIGFCHEWVQIEYVNALMDLAEAQDALDLAEAHLVKVPLLCISRGYGFASNEPRCSFEPSLTEHNKEGQE